MSNLHHSPHWYRIREKFKSQRIQDQEWKCAICGLDGRYFRLEVDHKVPVHKGGSFDSPANLQPLCTGCHIRKTRREREQPDPQRDRWIALLGF